MTVKSKGLTKYVVARDALLPSVDPPAEKLVKKSLPNEDPLKSCVRDRLSEGGRSQAEAEAWCRDYLSMKKDYDDSTAIDSANVREAERIMVESKESLKPYFIEQCTTTRQRLFGEPEYEAVRRCRQDWDLAERARGKNYAETVPAVATDASDALAMIHRLTDPTQAFHELEVLRLQLDSKTTEFMNSCSPEEADKRARKELGLPRVYPKRKPDVQTVPDAMGKTKEQRIRESYGTAADKRPGERMFSPHSGVPPLYGKTRTQIIKEVLEEHAEDKNR